MKSYIIFFAGLIMLQTSLEFCTPENVEVHTEVIGRGQVEPDLSLYPIIIVDGEVVEGDESSFDGTDLIFKATPEDGWIFDKWLYNGDQIKNTIEDDPTRFHTGLPDKEVLISAVFKRISGNLEILIEGAGEVVETMISSKTTTYNTDSKIKLRAEPYPGYKFSHWEGDYNTFDENAATDEEITVTIESDLSLTAVFVQKTAKIDISIHGKGSFTAQLKGGDTENEPLNLDRVPTGSTITLTAIPDQDSEFHLWVIDRADLLSDLDAEKETIEFSIPWDDEYLPIDLNFIDSEVTVPSGGVFNVDNFEQLFDVLLPALKGGFSDYSVNHEKQGIKLLNTSLSSNLLFDQYGKNLNSINHHYTEDGYIDYSEILGEKWSYTYNNLGRVSSVSFNTKDGEQTLDILYFNGNFAAIKFLGRTIVSVHYNDKNLPTALVFNIRELDIDNQTGYDFLSWTYYYDSENRVEKDYFFIAGSESKNLYYETREHTYDSNGKRIKTYIPEKEATISYTNPINNDVGYVRFNIDYLDNAERSVEGFIDFRKGYDYVTSYDVKDESGLDGWRFSEDRWEGIISTRGKSKWIDGKTHSYYLAVEEVNQLGQISKAYFGLNVVGYPDESIRNLGTFEVVNGKAVFRDSNNSIYQSNQVPVVFRELTRINNDDKPYDEYDDLFRPFNMLKVFY